MRLGTKPPALAVSDEAAVALLEQLSKAALIDLVAQAAALDAGHCDTPCTGDELLDYVLPVLRVRGDRPPKI